MLWVSYQLVHWQRKKVKGKIAWASNRVYILRYNVLTFYINANLTILSILFRFHISSGNDDSTKISSIKSQEAGHFSLYVINVGKLQLVLILSICEEDLKEAFVRNLWNIAITNLPPVETILYDWYKLIISYL